MTESGSGSAARWPTAGGSARVARWFMALRRRRIVAFPPREPKSTQRTNPDAGAFRSWTDGVLWPNCTRGWHLCGAGKPRTLWGFRWKRCFRLMRSPRRFRSLMWAVRMPPTCRWRLRLRCRRPGVGLGSTPASMSVAGGVRPPSSTMRPPPFRRAVWRASTALAGRWAAPRPACACSGDSSCLASKARSRGRISTRPSPPEAWLSPAKPSILASDTCIPRPARSDLPGIGCCVLRKGGYGGGLTVSASPPGFWPGLRSHAISMVDRRRGIGTCCWDLSLAWNMTTTTRRMTRPAPLRPSYTQLSGREDRRGRQREHQNDGCRCSSMIAANSAIREPLPGRPAISSRRSRSSRATRRHQAVCQSRIDSVGDPAGGDQSVRRDMPVYAKSSTWRACAEVRWRTPWWSLRTDGGLLTVGGARAHARSLKSIDAQPGGRRCTHFVPWRSRWPFWRRPRPPTPRTAASMLSPTSTWCRVRLWRARRSSSNTATRAGRKTAACAWKCCRRSGGRTASRSSKCGRTSRHAMRMWRRQAPRNSATSSSRLRTHPTTNASTAASMSGRRKPNSPRMRSTSSPMSTSFQPTRTVAWRCWRTWAPIRRRMPATCATKCSSSRTAWTTSRSPRHGRARRGSTATRWRLTPALSARSSPRWPVRCTTRGFTKSWIEQAAWRRATLASATGPSARAAQRRPARSPDPAGVRPASRCAAGATSAGRPPCRPSSRRPACPADRVDRLLPGRADRADTAIGKEPDDIRIAGSGPTNCRSARSRMQKAPGDRPGAPWVRIAKFGLLELQRGAEPDDVHIGAHGVDHAVRIEIALVVVELMLPVEAGDVVDQNALGPDVLEADADVGAIVPGERLTATDVEDASAVQVGALEDARRPAARHREEIIAAENPAATAPVPAEAETAASVPVVLDVGQPALERRVRARVKLPRLLRLVASLRPPSAPIAERRTRSRWTAAAGRHGSRGCRCSPWSRSGWRRAWCHARGPGVARVDADIGTRPVIDRRRRRRSSLDGHVGRGGGPCPRERRCRGESGNRE